jgi:pimeloyl-ACP methyl ester carboxylesterase
MGLWPATPASCGQPRVVQAQSATASKSGYAPVNGLNIYYEIHGTGEPLVLLHGGLGSMAMFGDLVPMFAQTRRVITVDLQAHGHTADIDRPITYEAMADDIAALMKDLQIEKADFMGCSLGRGRFLADHRKAS